MHRVTVIAPVLAAALLGAVVVAASASRHQDRVPDFDGDGVGDPTIWRPPSGDATTGAFYALTSRTGFTQQSRAEIALGVSGDIPVVADYDGDGIADFAVYHPIRTFTWSVLLSSQNFTSTATYQWGVDQDIAMPGDYDGDGKTDIAVYRPADNGWYILQAGSNFKSAFKLTWGVAGATPLRGDFDGDGRLDLAFYYFNGDGDGVGDWYVIQGGTNFRSAFKGKLGATDVVSPLAADFDGDGAVDLTVYDAATSTFTVRYFATRYQTGGTNTVGVQGDIPALADYDDDGKADVAVFRPSNATYYILTSGSGFSTLLTRSVAAGGSELDKGVFAR